MSLICVHNLHVHSVFLQKHFTILGKSYDCVKTICLLHCKLFSSISAEEKEQFIKRLKTFKIQQKSNSQTILKNAAVLVPFCRVNGELSILYTLRKLHLKRHKGQVSFPGGRQDSNDSSLQITALRETEEELGISKSLVEIWGEGNVIVGKEFNILPVVGFVGDININSLKPNLEEVELAFTIPLHHFYDLNNCKYTQYRNMYTLPVFINTKCKVWGITALITHIVLRAFSPTKYHHLLKFIKFRK